MRLNFARTLAHREAKIPEALRQVSTLPHRESDGFILLYFSGLTPIVVE